VENRLWEILITEKTYSTLARTFTASPGQRAAPQSFEKEKAMLIGETLDINYQIGRSARKTLVLAHPQTTSA
jgi:hypothetical protein